MSNLDKESSGSTTQVPQVLLVEVGEKERNSNLGKQKWKKKRETGEIEKHANCQRVKFMNFWIKWTADLNPRFTMLFFFLRPKSKNTFPSFFCVSFSTVHLFFVSLSSPPLYLLLSSSTLICTSPAATDPSSSTHTRLPTHAGPSQSLFSVFCVCACVSVWI